MRGPTGDYPAAARDLEKALGLYHDIDDPGGKVEALNVAGTLHRLGGDLRKVRTCHQQALGLARQIPSAYSRAQIAHSSSPLAGSQHIAITAPIDGDARLI